MSAQEALSPPAEASQQSGRWMRAFVVGLIGLLALEVLLAGLDAAFPPNLARGEHSSPVVLDRRGAWLRALPVENGRWRIRADLERTDPTFLARLVRMEDGRFFEHQGVDPLSLLRAVGSMILHGRAVSGASTLTMQTARLLEPRPRNLGSKLIEMVRAVQLEARFSKRQILALYLTLAPYGGNLEGARSASLAYFGHEPSTLTNGEQALLIALPQAPEARRPDRRREAARAARQRVLDRFVAAGFITTGEASEAEAEPLPDRQAFPSLAWHLAGQLAAHAPRGQASVVSTLDGQLQSRIEPIVARAAAAQGREAQVAAIVVQIHGRAVRALVGSAGLGRDGGWIDMTRAIRSPGSALKPFIYAVGFDLGLVAPDTQVDDTPTRFGDYQPEDFDRVFRGRVTVREALVHSLNVPAVATLNRIGAPAFEARLQAAGARLVRPRHAFHDAGLALALGGEGISMRDLALLYAALGDDGLARPLTWTEDAAHANQGRGGVRLVSASSARQILDILREAPMPAGRAPPALARGAPAMAFKTGTSYGFRDAVAAGVIGDYVIVVWTGRADGGARPDVAAREIALPILFDIADRLDAPANAPRPIAPRAAPRALEQLASPDVGPRLIFPPDRATVQVEGFGPTSRGLALAAGGEGLRWFVDGQPLAEDPVSHQVIWRPANAGFFRVNVIDGQGRQAASRVRIRGPASETGTRP
jgi:penicillin-binding protein 1C